MWENVLDLIRSGSFLKHTLESLTGKWTHTNTLRHKIKGRVYLEYQHTRNQLSSIIIFSPVCAVKAEVPASSGEGKKKKEQI